MEIIICFYDMKVFDLINYVNKLSYNGYDAVFKKVFI